MPMDILGLKQNRFHDHRLYAALEKNSQGRHQTIMGKTEILQQWLDKGKDDLR
jgi:hypothetical protein